MGQILSSNYVPLYDNNYKPAIRQLDTLDINVLYNIRYYCPVNSKTTWIKCFSQVLKSLPITIILELFGETLEISAADKNNINKDMDLGIQNTKTRQQADNSCSIYLEILQRYIQGKGITFYGVIFIYENLMKEN
ncbi:hypothetical protein pb186bvf_009156 [Paramecium bursaria]